MARQQHGFTFEDKIIASHGWKKTGYTDEFDAFTVKGTPVQIKTFKAGTKLDLGDFFRNAEKSQDFLLIVGFYSGEVTNITKQHTLWVPAAQWAPLFAFSPTDPRANNIKKVMKDDLKLISNLHAADEQWKDYCRDYKKLWLSSIPDSAPPQRVTSIYFKRDHKVKGGQKRIQCGITYKNWRDYFLKVFRSVNAGEY